jgi:hypothetical protein
MKLITVISSNDVQRTVACEDINAQGRQTTIRDVCADPAVLAFFGVEQASQVADAIDELNGNEITDGIRSLILDSAVQDDMTVSVDLEADEEPEADEDTQNGEAAPQNGGYGVCSVLIGGGLQSVNLEIELGRTTVQDVIHNDRVRARSGMTDAQLSSCSVFINNVEITANAIPQRLVNNNETIVLSPRAAHTKG